MSQINKIAVSVLLVLSSTSLFAQTSDVPQIKKTPQHIAIGYDIKSHLGKIRAADDTGKIQQWLEIWEDDNKKPVVVTYMAISDDGKTFSVTWGAGVINTTAFNCVGDSVPAFTEKTFWVATVKEGKNVFEEIKDSSVKGLFENLARVRDGWGRDVNSQNQRNMAALNEQNILDFMSQKNRKKFVEAGWMQPTNSCIKHF